MKDDIIRAIRGMDQELTISPHTAPEFTVSRQDISDIMVSCGVSEDEAVERLAGYVVERLSNG